MPFIYQAVWKNGYVYIGQTLGDMERLTKRYASYAKSKRKTNRPSEMACRLHGLPTFYVLETCSPTELDEREQYWIRWHAGYQDWCLNVRQLTTARDKEAARMLVDWEEDRERRFQARVLQLLAL